MSIPATVTQHKSYLNLTESISQSMPTYSNTRNITFHQHQPADNSLHITYIEIHKVPENQKSKQIINIQATSAIYCNQLQNAN